MSLITLLGIGAALPIGAFVLGCLLVFAVMRYWGGGRSGVIPVRIYPGQAFKLFEAAQAGNKPMVIEALRKAFELDLAKTPLNNILSEWALDDVQKRMKDPAHPAYIIDAIAKFTGLTPEEVFATVKEDFTPKESTPAVPVVAAAALLLCLCLPSTSSAAYPAGQTWGMPVQGPQRSYGKPAALIQDPPLMRDQQGQLVAFKPQPAAYYTGGSLPVEPDVSMPIQPPDGSQYQPVNYSNGSVGFWQRGPVRRFIANRQPVRRAGRFVGRVALAPFRFIFRRRGC